MFRSDKGPWENPRALSVYYVTIVYILIEYVSKLILDGGRFPYLCTNCENCNLSTNQSVFQTI